MPVDIGAYISEQLTKILAVDRVSVQDNFFALGGDSLAAVELMESVESEFGIEFPLDVLFASGEVGQVIAECSRRAQSDF
jgi:acyl carrier protein